MTKKPYMIDPATGKVLWTPCIEKEGCKKRNRDGSFRKNNATDRKRYAEKHGPWKKGEVLDHVCNNPSCRNPEHHDRCTQSENIRRGILRGTREAVERVRWPDSVTWRVFEMWHVEGKSQADILEETGVASACISNWIAGRFKPRIAALWNECNMPVRQ